MSGSVDQAPLAQAAGAAAFDRADQAGGAVGDHQRWWAQSPVGQVARAHGEV